MSRNSDFFYLIKSFFVKQKSKQTKKDANWIDVIGSLDTEDYNTSYAIAVFDVIDSTSLNNMIKTIAAEYHWAPTIIGAFFIDEIDYNGIFFWYNEIQETNLKLKAKQSAKK